MVLITNLNRDTALSEKEQLKAACSYVISNLSNQLKKSCLSEVYYTATISVFAANSDKTQYQPIAEQIVKVLNEASGSLDPQPKVILDGLEIVVQSTVRDLALKNWMSQLFCPKTIYTSDEKFKSSICNMRDADLSKFTKADVTNAEASASSIVNTNDNTTTIQLEEHSQNIISTKAI